VRGAAVDSATRPVVIELSDSVPSARLRNVPILDAFLHDLPLFFSGTDPRVICWPRCLLSGGPDSTWMRCPVLAGNLTRGFHVGAIKIIVSVKTTIIWRRVLFAE
jgi:hypothetical protein